MMHLSVQNAAYGTPTFYCAKTGAVAQEPVAAKAVADRHRCEIAGPVRGLRAVRRGPWSRAQLLKLRRLAP